MTTVTFQCALTILYRTLAQLSSLGSNRSCLKNPRGREIDYGELHRENMLPEDVIADYDSFFTRTNRLKGGGKVEYQCTVVQSAL